MIIHTGSPEISAAGPAHSLLIGRGIRWLANGGELPGYWVFNAGISQNLDGPGALEGVTIRADVLNLFDKSYQIRSGTAVGVGAPQWGQRRAIFVGISKKFG